MRRMYDEKDLDIDERRGRCRVKAGVRGSSKRDAKAGRRGRGIRVTNHSVGDPNTLPPVLYRSQLEEDYAQRLDLLKKAGVIKDWKYEPFILILPGEKNRYKPDFLLEFPDRHVEIHETKGFSRNIREGMTKVKTAAGLNRWARFALVQREDGKWSVRTIEAA
jgi:hypothetical protein